MAKKRTSENKHKFTDKIMRELNAFSIENITMNENMENPLCGLEAITVELGELFRWKKTLLKLFTANQLRAKFFLCKELEIPFYIIVYNENTGYYRISECYVNNSTNKIDIIDRERYLSMQEFLKWYKRIKPSTQTKELSNGAEKRIGTIDCVLDEFGMQWGGNVDAFIVGENKKIMAIIDNISIGDGNLEKDFLEIKQITPYSFRANSVIAKKLRVPHIICTIDKRRELKEHMGISVLKELILTYPQIPNEQSIFFYDNINPKDNICEGVDSIKAQFDQIITNKEKYQPPKITTMNKRY